ncbi:MAG: ABC transporter permease [Dethiobacteria bacterium]|nr:ABC transporter permease [Dethiobacteria bacterium]
MEGVIAFFQYFWDIREMVFELTIRHAWMALVGIALGTLTAVPIGIIISRRPRLSVYVIDLAGMLYTIPSLALLGFLLPFVGLGWLPTIMALVIYSWLPVLRNTCTGILGVDPAAKEAAKGMGATSTQLLFNVELPLAMPVIMAAVRTVAVLTVGITVMGALVGARGLGELIFQGISMMDNRMILAGTIPVSIMALFFDQILGLVERKLKVVTSSA